MNRRLTRNFTLGLAVSVTLAALASGASDKRRERSSAASAPNTAPAAQGTPVQPANGFEAFQLIVERNIFNPNRVGRTRPAVEEKVPHVDEISLVGTMNYDKGLVAFFDSPDSNFRKALREGDTVADFKIQRITADGVELLQGDKPVPLKVTQQLRRPEGGEWSVRSTPVAAPAGDSRTGSAGGTTMSNAEPAPAEIPADASEVLKRLMKKREKQLK